MLVVRIKENALLIVSIRQRKIIQLLVHRRDRHPACGVSVDKLHVCSELYATTDTLAQKGKLIVFRKLRGKNISKNYREHLRYFLRIFSEV